MIFHTCSMDNFTHMQCKTACGGCMEVQEFFGNLDVLIGANFITVIQYTQRTLPLRFKTCGTYNTFVAQFQQLISFKTIILYVDNMGYYLEIYAGNDLTPVANSQLNYDPIMGMGIFTINCDVTDAEYIHLYADDYLYLDIYEWQVYEEQEI